jgi:hypothetical protein
MKNAYQRRRVKARVEKRARMKKLDAITLDFARQVIEEETGAPLQIQAPSPGDVKPAHPAGATAGGGAGSDPSTGSGLPRATSRGEARLIARDDRKNPLISTFDWTSDAVQRILRVPAGFMRSQTQERVEELARERAASAIDLALVEDGIEIGKRMMAEMIANYPTPGKGTAAAPISAAPSAGTSGTVAESPGAARNVVPAGNGSGYLNEVSPLTVRSTSGDHREA